METNIVVQDRANDIAEFSIIQSKIYEIRGQRVMFDFDLAAIYEVETRVLKQSVRRNLKRFEGEDFMFELTKKEVIELSRSQIVTLNKGRGSNIKYPPFAFTELGIAMLSSVLNSDSAIDTNKKIMRAFVALRKYISDYAELNQKIELFMQYANTKFDKNDAIFKEILSVLDELVNKKKELEKPRTMIGFKRKE
jgi:hypothetical protein